MVCLNVNGKDNMADDDGDKTKATQLKMPSHTTADNKCQKDNHTGDNPKSVVLAANDPDGLGITDIAVHTYVFLQ